MKEDIINKTIDIDFINSFYNKYKLSQKEGFFQGEEAIYIAKKMGKNINDSIRYRESRDGNLNNLTISISISEINNVPLYRTLINNDKDNNTYITKYMISQINNIKGITFHSTQFIQSTPPGVKIPFNHFDEYFFDNYQKYSDMVNLFFRKEMLSILEEEKILKNKSKERKLQTENKFYSNLYDNKFYLIDYSKENYGSNFKYPILSICSGKILREALDKASNFEGIVYIGDEQVFSFEYGEACEILLTAEVISKENKDFLENRNIPAIDIVEYILEK